MDPANPAGPPLKTTSIYGRVSIQRVGERRALDDKQTVLYSADVR